MCLVRFLRKSFFGKDLSPVEILNPGAYQNHFQSSCFISDKAQHPL